MNDLKAFAFGFMRGSRGSSQRTGCQYKCHDWMDTRCIHVGMNDSTGEGNAAYE